MHIVHYYPRAAVGNGGLTRELARAGGRVTVGFHDGEAPRSPAGVRWVPIRSTGGPGVRIPLGLDGLLRGADVLVLYSGWVLHNVAAAEAARRAGVPYVLAPRGAYDPSVFRRKRTLKLLWWAALEHRLLLNASAVQVFFESQREHLVSLGYGGPAIVVPNGVEPPPGVAWDGGSGGYVAWLGRFDPEHKGLDVLVEAVGMLPPDERPTLRLHGPDWRGHKRYLSRLVDRLGLSGSITVGGPVYGTRKWDLLARAAGFVYPSRWEGFGNSVAEAVSIGVPALVTPYPLGRELASGGGAYLAEPTPASVAGGLRRLLSSDSGRVGRNGAQLIRERNSWRAVARSWLEQTEEVLRSKT
jgi:glycosyltransferase involved in cell wall biosynthesis